MEVPQELSCFNSTLRLCGIPADVPPPPRNELLQLALSLTRAKFPSCQDILSDTGVTRDQLKHAICCLSLTLQHNTEARNCNGKNMFFVCWTNSKHEQRRSKRMLKVCTVLGVKDDGINCPFYLHFYKKNDRWFLQKKDELNSVSILCQSRNMPDICAETHFLKFMIEDWVKNTGQDVKSVKTESFLNTVRDEAFKKFHIHSVRRVLCDLRSRSKDKVLESDQKVESYVRDLNKNEQFAVVLYSTNELIVPGPSCGDECEVREFSESDSSAMCSPDDESMNFPSYWDGLRAKESVCEEKQIVFTHANMAMSITFLMPNLFMHTGISSMQRVSDA